MRGVCCVCQGIHDVVKHFKSSEEFQEFQEKYEGGFYEDEVFPFVMTVHCAPGTLTRCDGEGTTPQALVLDSPEQKNRQDRIEDLLTTLTVTVREAFESYDQQRHYEQLSTIATAIDKLVAILLPVKETP